MTAVTRCEFSWIDFWGNMEFSVFEWNGFSGVKFDFRGMPVKVVKPNVAANGKWALKTEYFGAFPNAEIALLNRGWHIVFQQNENRWAQEYDLERKEALVREIPAMFSLCERFSAVGMSCGGMYAVLLAARCPELVDVLYLDAPVLNLLSCPCDMGIAQSGLYPEFFGVTGLTKSEMLSYRNHPIDKIHILLEGKIPVLLIAGDRDSVVPYVENGKILADYYEKNGGVIEVILKKDCDHHPHGLENGEAVADIIEHLCRT